LNKAIIHKDGKIGSPNRSNGINAHSSKQADKYKDRCLHLYEKGKAKNVKDKINQQKKIQEKEEKLLSECTFKPRTISALGKDPNEKPATGKQFYERTVNWKKKMQENVEKEKTESLKKEVVYKFKPEIHVPKKETLFDPKKNIDKTNKVTKKFMDRQENARTEEVKKKERYENLGKVKANAGHIKTSSLNIITSQSHDVNHHGNNLGDIVKNLRGQLQEIRLESTNEINI